MLDQRHADVVQMLYKCFVFAGLRAMSDLYDMDRYNGYHGYYEGSF